MSNDDFSFFLQEMQDVSPLKPKSKADIRKTAEKTPGQQQRREAAQQELHDPNFLSLENPVRVKPHDMLVWKRDGVQEGVFKKLRLGKYPVDARLDLHLKTAKEARIEVFQFINDCRRFDLRTILLVHGRGEQSHPPAKLKSYVFTWLPQFEEVLAFHSAQREHGGNGAVYVLLRKSEEKKQENRERHLRRR